MPSKLTAVDVSVGDRWKSVQTHTESSDITFLVGPNQTPIKAHKCILASSSKAFQAMFYKGMNESSVDTTPIGDDRLTPSSFSAFLDFVYTGEASISAENVFGVLFLADLYDFANLLESCHEFFNKFLSMENSASIFAQAELWGNTEIAQQALALIFSNPAVALSQSLSSLTLPQLQTIVQSSELNISEIELFKLVFRWYKQNEQEENLRVFSHIRYGLISTADLVAYVGRANVLSKDLYLHALEFSVENDEKRHPDVLWDPRKRQTFKAVATEPTTKPLPSNSPTTVLTVPPILPVLSTPQEIVKASLGHKSFIISPLLKTLDLSRVNMGIAAIRYFAQAMQSNNTLTALSLQKCSIGGQATQYLSQVLKKNNSLTTLDLQHNGIGYTGVNHLAEAFTENKALKTIDLTKNDIHHASIISLFKALDKNKTIQTILVSVHSSFADMRLPKRVIVVT